jgi:hypothetical protein
VSVVFHLPTVAVCCDYWKDVHIDVIHSRNESNRFDLTNVEYDVCVKFELMEGLDYDIVCEKQGPKGLAREIKNRKICRE